MSRNKHRMRRKRRQAKQSMRHGKAAKPKHALQAGRTGNVHYKRLQSMRPRSCAEVTPADKR